MCISAKNNFDSFEKHINYVNASTQGLIWFHGVGMLLTLWQIDVPLV